MELAKCVRCGKLFNKIKLSVCQPCESEEDREILKVQSHLRDHPSSSLEDASNELEIYLDDIERWIMEKRLTIQFTKGASVKCILCGQPIVTGRVCSKCSERLGSSFAVPEVKKSTHREESDSGRIRGGDSDGFGVAQKYHR
jgi:hypothetical protein